MKLATPLSRHARRRAAFTLLEVLVVVAILVILAGVGVVATTKYLEDARKSKAQLGCKGLETAVQAYYLNPQSGNVYPQQLSELLNPFNSGTSLLKNGQDDLMDPWGKQYQLMFTTGLDGSQVPVVHTTANDGTPISQYGIGNLAKIH